MNFFPELATFINLIRISFGNHSATAGSIVRAITGEAVEPKCRCTAVGLHSPPRAELWSQHYVFTKTMIDSPNNAVLSSKS